MAKRTRRPADPTKGAAKSIAKTKRALAQVKKQQQREDTKQLRSAVAALKRLGVIRKSVDARKVKNTRYRRKQVKDFAPVLEGKIAAVKASPKVRKEFKAAGARIVNGRILVAKEPGQVAAVRKGTMTEGVVTLRKRITPDYQLEEIIIPIPPQTVGDLLDDMQNRPNKYNTLKNKEDNFGFRINGHNSGAVFANVQGMIDVLSRYQTIDDIADVDREEAPEFFTVYRLNFNTPWYAGGYKRKPRARSEASRERKNAKDRARRARDKGKPPVKRATFGTDR